MWLRSFVEVLANMLWKVHFEILSIIVLSFLLFLAVFGNVHGMWGDSLVVLTHELQFLW